MTGPPAPRLAFRHIILTRARRVRIMAHIAGNIPAQQIQRVRPDPRNTVQLQLHEKRRVGDGGGGRQAMRHDPEHKTAAVVFHAAHGFERALILYRIVPASHRAPAARNRPLRGHIPLPDRRRDALPVCQIQDRKSTRLNSSHVSESRMPSSA